ncbi:MAG: hypothetical protein ACYST6_00225 [Planctomycetota bacterium]
MKTPYDAAMNFLRWTGVGHSPVYSEDIKTPCMKAGASCENAARGSSIPLMAGPLLRLSQEVTQKCTHRPLTTHIEPNVRYAPVPLEDILELVVTVTEWAVQDLNL